jgi:hypothetical protein
MKPNRINQMVSMTALLLLTAAAAQAYDPNYEKATCDNYSKHGLGERYVFGGDKGWIDNGVWDDSSTEGVDCSSYVPRCWGIDGANQTFIGEHTAGGHPYSTAAFYPGNVANTTRLSGSSSVQQWDCFVYHSCCGGPGDHMGLIKEIVNGNALTREAQCTACGVVSDSRPVSTLSSWSTRYYKRSSWGADSGNGQSATFMTAPVVLKNADGRLEVFMVGANKALYHKYQTAVNGSWSGWFSMGGTIKKGIAGLVDYQGLIHIFAVDDATTKVFHIRQQSTGWTPWVELGSTSANVKDGLSAVNRADGRIMVFGVNDDTLNVNRCMTTTPGGSWSAWGLVGTGGTVLNGLSAVTDASDNVHVFAVDDVDYGLRHIRLQSDGTWTPWANRGGDNNREVSAWRHADGRVRVYTRHRVNKTVSGWAQASPGGTWAGPVTISSGTVNKGLCVVTDAQSGDYPHIFAVNDSTTAGVHIRLQSGGTWTPWVSLAGDLRPRCAAIKDVQTTPRLEVFAISSGGGTMYRTVQNADGTWPNYSAFSTPLP